MKYHSGWGANIIREIQVRCTIIYTDPAVLHLTHPLKDITQPTQKLVEEPKIVHKNTFLQHINISFIQWI